MKKLLSAILVLCLLIVPFGAITAYAENTVDVALTGFVSPTGFNAGNNHHVIYFSTSAPVPGGDGHAFTCGWPPITVKKVAADGSVSTETFGVAGGPTSHHNGMFLMIPADKIPACADIAWGDEYYVTFPKGLYGIVDADSANFADDYTFMINHQGYFTQAEMASVSSTVVKNVTGIPSASSATGLYFNVENVAAMPSAGDWTQAYVDLSSVEAAKALKGGATMRLTHTDGTVTDYTIGYDPAWRLKKISDSQFYLGGFGTAVAGDVLTLDGYFYARNAGTWNYNDNKTILYHFNNLKFAFNGTAWTDATPVQYAFSGDFTGVLDWASSFSEKDARWNIYLTNDFGIDSTWDYKYVDFTYVIDGVSYTTRASSTDVGGTLYFNIPATILSGDAEKTITVKAGGYLANGRKDKNLNVLNDFTLYTGDGDISDQPIEKGTTYTGTPRLSSVGSYGSAAGFYFAADEGMPVTGWDLRITAADGDDNGIFYNDVKTNGAIKKIDTNVWYVGVTAFDVKKGDKITVTGNFVNGKDIITMETMDVYFTGECWANTIGSLSFNKSSGVDMYLNATDALPFDGSWATATVAANREDSGVFLNGVKTSVRLKKLNSVLYYVCNGDAGLAPAAGDVLTIKGIFTTQGKVGCYDEFNCIWNGTAWTTMDASMAIGTQTKGSNTRVILKLNGDAEDYDTVSFKIVNDGVTTVVGVDCIYDSFYNNGTLVTAEALNCNYVAILEIGNITTASSVTVQGLYTSGDTTTYGTIRTIK